MRFICNEYQEPNGNAYNCGGLARFCEEGKRRKMLDRMNVFLQDSVTEFHEATTRLYMKDMKAMIFCSRYILPQFLLY